MKNGGVTGAGSNALASVFVICLVSDQSFGGKLSFADAMCC